MVNNSNNILKNSELVNVNKEVENNILKEIIIDYNNKYNKYIKKSKFELNEIIDKICKDITPSNDKYYYKLTENILDYIKKIIYKYKTDLPLNTYITFQNILYYQFNNNLYSSVNNFELVERKSKIRKHLNTLFKYNIKFCKFIDKYKKLDYDTKGIFMREFFLASIMPYIFISKHKIKNFKVWYYIRCLWIIFDNICDMKDLNTKHFLIKNTKMFFINKIYEKSYDEIIFYLETNNEPCLKIFKKLFKLKDISKEKKIGICKIFAKLFYYSYKSKKNEKLTSLNDVLTKTIIKAKLSMDICSYCFDYKFDKLIEFYKFSFMIQLIDDFIDIKEDIYDENITLFTRDNINLNRTINIFILIEYLNELLPDIDKNIIKAIIIGLDNGKEKFDKTIVDLFKKNLNINYNNFNLTNILDILSDQNFIKNISLLFLHNNILTNDDDKIKKQILIDIKSFSDSKENIEIKN